MTTYCKACRTPTPNSNLIEGVCTICRNAEGICKAEDKQIFDELVSKENAIEVKTSEAQTFNIKDRKKFPISGLNTKFPKILSEQECRDIVLSPVDKKNPEYSEGIHKDKVKRELEPVNFEEHEWVEYNGSKIPDGTVVEVVIRHCNPYLTDLNIEDETGVGHFGDDGFYFEDGGELSFINWNIIKWRIHEPKVKYPCLEETGDLIDDIMLCGDISEPVQRKGPIPEEVNWDHVNIDHLTTMGTLPEPRLPEKVKFEMPKSK
ncbi:MAG: hypothetical protein KKD44_26360 [Proteobacteria bacterium]|nr:hypothetical protein [Pseudomonadota bacterium]